MTLRLRPNSILQPLLLAGLLLALAPVASAQDEPFSTYCRAGDDATAKEAACFAVCQPLEERIEEALADESVYDLFPEGVAPLIDLLLPLVSEPENVLVDRDTGELMTQFIPEATGLGVSLLYQRDFPLQNDGLKALIALVLKQATLDARATWEDTETAAERICTLVKQYDINVNESKQTLDEFETANEFIAREITPGVRTIDLRPGVIAAPADSAGVAYNRLEAAQTFWIKGRAFTIEDFLDNIPELIARYSDPTLGIFRLSIDDYHGFHAPLPGTVTRIHRVQGDYFSVQPLALENEHVSIYTENTRTLIEIENPTFGKYLMTAVGATEIGSVVLRVAVGDKVGKGQRLGHFEFGGSTVVLTFPRGTVLFDTDLLIIGSRSIEAKVAVGERVGVRTN